MATMQGKPPTWDDMKMPRLHPNERDPFPPDIQVATMIWLSQITSHQVQKAVNDADELFPSYVANRWPYRLTDIRLPELYTAARKLIQDGLLDVGSDNNAVWLNERGLMWIEAHVKATNPHGLYQRLTGNPTRSHRKHGPNSKAGQHHNGGRKRKSA